MLLSVVVQLKALENGSLPGYTGAAIRAEFLKWVGGIEPQKSTEAHNGDDLRPYTISDLNGTFRAQQGFRMVESGQAAWFRVTSLSEPFSKLLLQEMEEKDKVVPIGRVRFQRIAMSEKDHPWARQSSYEELADRYFKSKVDPPDTIELDFFSPTMYNSNG